MDKVKGLAILAFIASIGIALVVLSCALPDHNWWPIFVIVFYILSPVPLLLWYKYQDRLPISSTMFFEIALFVTTIFAISSFGYPIVLAKNPHNAPVIKWGSAGLVLAANFFIYTSLGLSFRVFKVRK